MRALENYQKEHFQCFWNETDRFLECRYISLASKSCNDFFTIRFPTVLKLFMYRENASSNFATVTFLTVFKMCRHRVNAVLLIEEKVTINQFSEKENLTMRIRISKSDCCSSKRYLLLVEQLHSETHI